MKLIVGLGNPGKKYERTRHNTGFLVIDALAEKLDISLNRKAFNATTGKGQKVVLMKPETFMNNSGVAVRKAVNYYHLDPERDLIVVYDDLDLPLGKIRLRESGSAGGHNGMKSIISNLGTKDFCRIRIGIGGNYSDSVDYVLGRFRADEKQLWMESIERAAEACEEALDRDFQELMNKFN